MNAYSSPSGAPSDDRRRSASANTARGDSTCRARVPPQLAGDNRNTRLVTTVATIRKTHTAAITGSSGDDDDHAHHRRDKQPVARPGRPTRAGVMLEQRKVPGIGFPEHIRDVADERHDADHHVDRRC